MEAPQVLLPGQGLPAEDQIFFHIFMILLIYHLHIVIDAGLIRPLKPVTWNVPTPLKMRSCASGLIMYLFSLQNLFQACPFAELFLQRDILNVSEKFATSMMCY